MISVIIAVLHFISDGNIFSCYNKAVELLLAMSHYVKFAQ